MAKDYKELIEARRAKAVQKPGQVRPLRSVAPLTGPDSDRAVTTRMAFPAVTPGDAATRNPDTEPTRITNLDELARSTRRAEPESDAQFPGRAVEIPPPVEAAPPVPQAPVEVPPQAPVAAPPTAEHGTAPASTPKAPTPIEEAMTKVMELGEKVEGLTKAVDLLLKLAAGSLPKDVIEAASDKIAERGGLLGMADAQEDATTVLLGNIAKADLASLVQAIKDGKEPGLLDEMAVLRGQLKAESPDHAEILRTSVVRLLLNPELKGKDVKGFAESRGADRVKEVLEGLSADPGIVRSVLIALSANVAVAQDAQEAAAWVESNSATVVSRAKECLDSWDNIIGGD